jgi:hypothetical protein
MHRPPSLSVENSSSKVPLFNPSHPSLVIIFFVMQTLLTLGIFASKVMIDLDHKYDPKSTKTIVFM